MPETQPGRPEAPYATITACGSGWNPLGHFLGVASTVYSQAALVLVGISWEVAGVSSRNR